MSWIPAAIGAASSIYGASKSGSSTSSSKNTMTAEQKALLKTLIAQVSSGVNQTGTTGPSSFVPTTDTEQSYLDMVSDLGKNQALNNMIEGKVPYEIGPEWAEQYFEESIKPEYMKEYSQVTMPGINKAYSGSTYWGTDRMAATAKAGENLATTLGSKKAGLMYDEELARRTAIESAYNRIPSAIQTKGTLMESAGQLTRGIEQEKAADIVSRYLSGETVQQGDQTYQNNAYNPNIQLALSLLGLGGTSTSTSNSGNARAAAIQAAGTAISNTDWSWLDDLKQQNDISNNTTVYNV